MILIGSVTITIVDKIMSGEYITCTLPAKVLLN